MLRYINWIYISNLTIVCSCWSEFWRRHSRSHIQSKQWTNCVNITIHNFGSQMHVVLLWLINDGISKTSLEAKSSIERTKWIVSSLNYGNTSNKKQRIPIASIHPIKGIAGSIRFTQGILPAMPFIGRRYFNSRCVAYWSS